MQKVAAALISGVHSDHTILHQAVQTALAYHLFPGASQSAGSFLFGVKMPPSFGTCIALEAFPTNRGRLFSCDRTLIVEWLPYTGHCFVSL